jgi:MFS family permease
MESLQTVLYTAGVLHHLSSALLQVVIFCYIRFFLNKFPEKRTKVTRFFEVLIFVVMMFSIGRFIGSIILPTITKESIEISLKDWSYLINIALDFLIVIIWMSIINQFVEPFLKLKKRLILLMKFILVINLILFGMYVFYFN